jgi:hypothetical protein
MCLENKLYNTDSLTHINGDEETYLDLRKAEIYICI